MLIDQVLSALSLYGLPVIVGVLFIGAVGIPMPSSLMLLVAGSFVAQGDLSFWPVLVLGSGAAIFGDSVGYCLGRCGGRRVVTKISRKVGGERRLQWAEEWNKKWGASGIFFSRWLVTPFGPWVNLASGIGEYSWPRFLLLVVTGEILWVALYVTLGNIFTDRVLALGGFLSDMTWALVGLVLVVLSGRKLWHYLQRSNIESAERRRERLNVFSLH